MRKRMGKKSLEWGKTGPIDLGHGRNGGKNAFVRQTDKSGITQPGQTGLESIPALRDFHRNKRQGCSVSRADLQFLPQWTRVALEQGTIHTEMVIDACDRLSKKIDEQCFPALETAIQGNQEKVKLQLEEAKLMLSRPWLEKKVQTELGSWGKEDIRTTQTQESSGRVITFREKRMPLGVLFHIGAGNMEGLPAYSVIEGLLAGNVNLVKTAEGDNGLTAAVLDLLIGEAPGLLDYIYVLNAPSEDLEAMTEIGMAADGIAVWGGDEAVKTVRNITPANVKLIEWGHKTSFCYVTESAWRDLREGNSSLKREMEDLADHICLTNQLYCNSCQGVFLDTENKKDLVEFGHFFLKLLEERRCREKDGLEEPEAAVRGSIAYRLKCLELERDKKVLRGKGCSVTLCRDCNLEASFMFGNCWARMLPSRNIVGRLKPYKNYLHTAGLVCGDKERDIISEKLLRAGLVRVVKCGDMSAYWPGQAHDGEYPLMRYSRIVAF